MNRNQQIAVVIGAVVVLLMLLFPPFHLQIRNTTSNMGYAFILHPPTRGYITASVNVGMLLVQWVGASLVTALAFATLKSSGSCGEARVATTNSVSAETTKQETPVDGSKSFLGGKYRPWRRFFARTVDVSTFGMLLFLAYVAIVVTIPVKAEGLARTPTISGSFLTQESPEQQRNELIELLDYSIRRRGATAAEQAPGSVLEEFMEAPIIGGFLLYLVLNLVLTLIWIPAEAAFLSRFGATPTKWLFGIRVVHSSGQFLSYSQALKRSFLVWIQGMGLGIPFVALFTQLFAYRRLTTTGMTLWDTSTSAVVTHKQWGVLRAVMCTAVVFGVVVLMVV
jgi:uncharacterized RDD family membrane protein YckC